MEFNFKNITIQTCKVTFNNGKTLTLKPPKLKALRKAANIKGDDAENVNELIEVVAILLSNNKENKKITPEFVENEFDIEEAEEFLTNYFQWVASIKQNPNF